MENKHLTFLLLLVFGNVLCYSQLDKGLIASYYFSGNVNDTVNGINGRAVGATLATDRFGNSNSAYHFDVVNNYISLGSNTDLRQASMTISLWFKISDFNSKYLNYPGIPLATTRVRPSVQCYEAFVIGIFLKNHKAAGANTSSLQQQVAGASKMPVDADKWYHIAYMFDFDTTYFYLNGELQEKNYKGFATNYALGDSIVLGHVGNNTPDTFKYHNYSWLNGFLDDLKFYNRVLTEEEVISLYKEFSPKTNSESADTIVNFVPLVRKFWFVPIIFLIAIFLTIIIIRWRINYFKRKEKERNDLQQKFAQMEMKALRSQMNPHFIFNAINSIQHYVLTNEKELANKYLVKFSQLMRNILDLSKQELISLKDELETVKLYLDIESLRFNNAFSFSVNIAEDVSPSEIRLPPLVIQPFVENAIWHGLLLKEGNKILEIRVFKKENNLVIEIDDNGIGREVSQKFNNKELKRRSFGMDITQDRLSVLEKVFGISISFDVLDKKDEKDQALGTTVFINIKL